MVPKLKLATGDFYYRDVRADREAEQEQLYRRIRGWLSLHLQADAQKPAE